ncbi:hypothetical protein DFP72DRAFT_495786 [Ephemerocybe angulata]|uniref:RING-type domain-containing protein n=1 Tax=Ephemerocybe angulata TaxID=980116 RepID=A0A8H6HRA8_9AGAR|nr:hypothetical protein DFP72DRAFT_495786 [Tulosesus angulatus]
MLMECAMCFSAFDSASDEVYHIPCGHCYCDSCFKFLTTHIFVCWYPDCRRDGSRLTPEDGARLRLKIGMASSHEDARALSSYKEAARIERGELKSKSEQNIPPVHHILGSIRLTSGSLAETITTSIDNRAPYTEALGTLSQAQNRLTAAQTRTEALKEEYTEAASRLHDARRRLFAKLA